MECGVFHFGSSWCALVTFSWFTQLYLWYVNSHFSDSILLSLWNDTFYFQICPPAALCSTNKAAGSADSLVLWPQMPRTTTCATNIPWFVFLFFLFLFPRSTYCSTLIVFLDFSYTRVTVHLRSCSDDIDQSFFLPQVESAQLLTRVSSVASFFRCTNGLRSHLLLYRRLPSEIEEGLDKRGKCTSGTCLLVEFTLSCFVSTWWTLLCLFVGPCWKMCTPHFLAFRHTGLRQPVSMTKKCCSSLLACVNLKIYTWG